MAKLTKTFIASLIVLITLFSMTFIGCSPAQTAKLYFNYGENEEVLKEEYKIIEVGKPVGALPKKTPSGVNIDFWIYEGKIITEDMSWWYRADVTAKAICLKENEYLCLFDLDGGSASEDFKFDLVYSTENVVSIENPTKEMHKFLGWVSEDGKAPIINLELGNGMVGHKTYKAIWQRNYSVSISLRSKCVEDGKTDYVEYTWQKDKNDPSTAIDCWFEVETGETLKELAYKPKPKSPSFKFSNWLWQKDETVIIDENTVFSEEIFGEEKEITIIIYTRHNYPSAEY